MKYISVLFLIICWTNTSTGQIKNLLGEWKMISVESKDYFYNIEKDTIAVSDEFKKKYPDPFDRKEMLKMVKKGMNNHHFIFEKDGNCTQKIDSLIVRTFKYEFNDSKNAIIVDDKTFGYVDYRFELSNEISSWFLKLILNYKDKPTTMTFRRIE